MRTTVVGTRRGAGYPQSIRLVLVRSVGDSRGRRRPRGASERAWYDGRLHSAGAALNVANMQEQPPVGSSHFQIIADIEATAQEAEPFAAAMLAWLVVAGIIDAEATDCVLAGRGHAPGARYATAVAEADPRLLEWRTNGVEIIPIDGGRAVYGPDPEQRRISASASFRRAVDAGSLTLEAAAELVLAGVRTIAF
ncbi:MAG: hypothetical protein JXA67_07430 [Micromonosporaceae bacterium]|nr:hypothetical protein [Micromonosporaceae bacterium]